MGRVKNTKNTPSKSKTKKDIVPKGKKVENTTTVRPYVFDVAKALANEIKLTRNLEKQKESNKEIVEIELSDSESSVIEIITPVSTLKTRETCENSEVNDSFITIDETSFFEQQNVINLADEATPQTVKKVRKRPPILSVTLNDTPEGAASRTVTLKETILALQPATTSSLAHLKNSTNVSGSSPLSSLVKIRSSGRYFEDKSPTCKAAGKITKKQRRKLLRMNKNTPVGKRNKMRLLQNRHNEDQACLDVESESFWGPAVRNSEAQHEHNVQPREIIMDEHNVARGGKKRKRRFLNKHRNQDQACVDMGAESLWNPALEDPRALHDNLPLREIVVDGQNVARGHAKNGFSPLGIRLVVDYFKSRGHKVVVFLPNNCKGLDRNLILKRMEDDNILVYTPSRKVDGRLLQPYDDRFIIEYASDVAGVVVSRDQYRDLMDENPRFRHTIVKRLLMYTFVGDMLMFPPDPFGQSGPSLDQLLHFEPGEVSPQAAKAAGGDSINSPPSEQGPTYIPHPQFQPPCDNANPPYQPLCGNAQLQFQHPNGNLQQGFQPSLSNIEQNLPHLIGNVQQGFQSLCGNIQQGFQPPCVNIQQSFPPPCGSMQQDFPPPCGSIQQGFLPPGVNLPQNMPPPCVNVEESLPFHELEIIDTGLQFH